MLKQIRSHVKKHLGSYIIIMALAVISASIYTAEAINPTRYVTQTGAGTKDGSSWTNALGEAEFAALTRISGTEGEFWVAAGTYRPSVTNDPLQSFQLQPQMKIYGGFKGNETLLSQRNPLKYKTVLTGDLGDDDYKNNGVTEHAGDIVGTNSKTVVAVTGGTSADTVLDGVTVTGGDNAGGSGGGVYIGSGSPLIKNCTFAGNRAETQGAGIATADASSAPVIDSCTFYGNETFGGGGGIYINSSSAAANITNCTFVDNTAAQGGAVYFSDSAASFVNCTATNNSANTAGGALYILNGTATVKNSILWEDIAYDGPEIKLGPNTSASVSYCVVNGGFTGGTHIITGDPGLWYFYYNGGYTKTYLIDQGGSAKDAGTASGAPGYDQRGIARPAGSGVDIGSVEYSAIVNSVFVDPSVLNMEIGDTHYLFGKVYPSEAETGAEIFTWSSSDASKATVTGGSVTALKEGTVTITGSFGGYSDTCEVTIVKRTPVVYNLPMSSGITYGQTLASSIITGGSADVPGTFAWETPSIAPSVADSNTTEYNVIFTPADTETYNTVTVQMTVTVNKAVPTVTEAPSAANLVYGQTLSSSVLTGGSANVPGTFSWSDPTIAPPATIGDALSLYTAVFTPADTVNYTVANIDIPVRVLKANSVITNAPSASAITYGQTLSSSVLTGGSANVPGTFSWSDPLTAPSVADSGSTEYGITFTPTDSYNYNSCFGTATLVINKADPTVIIPPSASSITYGQTLADSVLSGGSASVSGAFVWTDPGTAPAVSDSGVTAFPVTFIPDDQVNYNNAATDTMLAVGRAPTQYTSHGYDGQYDAAGHTIDVVVTAPESGYVIKYGTMAGVYDLDSPPLFTEAGSRTVYFEITSPNHTTERGSAVVNISKADAEIVSLPSASDITYGQRLSDSALNGGEGSVPGTFSWSDPSVVPTVADSGVTDFDIVFTPTDQINFKQASGSVKLTVNRAETVYEVNSFNDPYDHSPHGMSVTVTAPASGSTVMYGLEYGTYNLGVPPEFLTAGTHRVYFKITSPNHTEVESFADIVINKAEPQVISAPTGTAVTYGQTLADSVLSGGSASVPGTFVWTEPDTVPSVADSGVTAFPVTFIPDDSTNYSEKTLTAILSVNRAATQYNVTSYSGTYDGSPHGISVIVTSPSEGYSLTYGTEPGEYTSETPPSFTAAGTHFVYFHITSPNHTEVTGSGTVDIEKAVPSVVSLPSASAITYGQTLADSVLSGGSASVPGTFVWTEPGTAPTVADSDVTIFPVTFIPDDNDNYDTASASAKLTVHKADMTYSASGYTGTYDVSSHGISVSVSAPASGASVMYGTEPGNYPFTVSPVFANAGTYTVYFRITAENYNDEEGSANVAISKATPSIMAPPTAAAITYGQSLGDSALINGVGSVGGTFAWADPTVRPSVADSGVTAYPALFIPHDSDNYETVSFSSAVTVLRAALDYTSEGYSGVYDGAGHSVHVAVNTPSAGSVVRYGTAEGVYDMETPPLYTDAGSYTTYFEVSAENYTTERGSQRVEITKAVPVVSAGPSASAITYGQTLADSVLSGGSASVPGTFVWTEPGTAPTVADSDVTIFPVTFIPDDNDNYDTASASAKLTVHKADMTYSASGYTGTYDVSSHGISVSVSAPASGASVMYGTEPGNYPFTVSPVFANAGTYTVYFKITAENYNDEEGSANVAISKATPSIMAPPTAAAITYGQSLGDSALINGVGSVGGTFAWADPTVRPSVADSGVTAYPALFIPHDSDNYETVSFSSAVTVLRAALDYTSEGYSGVYDGAGHSVHVAVNTPSAGSVVRYGTAEGVYDMETPPLYTDAGSYTTYFEVSAENYTTERGSQRVEITKAVPAVSAGPSASAITYGQTLADSVLSGGSASVPGTFVWTEPGTAPAVSDSGVTPYGIAFIPEDHNNYETISSSLTLVVNRAQTVYTAKGFDGPYDRDPHSVSVTVAEPASGASIRYGTVQGVYENETPPSFINAGEYTVYFRITSPNHTEEFGSAQVLIRKVPAEITEVPSVFPITYGERLGVSYISGGEGSVPGSFSWENGSIIPSVSDSETTEYNIVFTPYDTVNYGPAVCSVTVHVDRADMVYSVSGYEGVYDGAGHGINVTVTKPGGAAVTYGTTPGVYDLTAPPLFTEVASHMTYYKIEDPNYNTVIGSVAVIITPMDKPVEITPDTRTDSENSGVLTVGKNTVEDFAIYDSLVTLGESLAAGIDPESADAVPAVSADITTSAEIFTHEEISGAINSAYGITPASRDMALTVSVVNTVGTDAAYQDADGNLLAKAYRFITDLFAGRTGQDVNGDYLPLEVKMTVPAENIEKLPQDIKNGLSENNFLERVSLFVLTHGETGPVATNICDIAAAGEKDKYIAVSQGPDGSYTVRSRFLVFNMPGTVPDGVSGAPFVQAVKISADGTGTRAGSYYLVQDGITDGYYDLCAAMAVKTLRGKLKVTVTGDLRPESADWTLTGEAHSVPVTYTGTRELFIEQDNWAVNIPEKAHYDLTIAGELSRTLNWGEDWEISAEYLKKRVTGLSTDIIPETARELRLNKESLRTVRLHAEVIPSDAFDNSIVWSSSDPEKVSVDQDGLVTALGLTQGAVHITARSVDGGYTAVQPVKVTNIVTSVSIPETAEVRVGGPSVTIAAEVSPADASDPSVIWTSSDTSRATVNENGVITAISAGPVTITATAAAGDGSPACTDTCALTVLPAIVHVTEVTVEPSALNINAGYTTSLRAVVFPSDATDKTVTWSSSNTAVASVSATGRVTGVSVGKATITATSTDGNKTGSCEVTVNNIPQPTVPVLPPDTPDAVLNEVKPAAAEFTENTSLIIRKVAPGTITADDLTADPVTGLVEVKGSLAIDLFNEKDLYKEIGSGDITELPVFAADVEAGKTVAVAFKVKGSELLAPTPDKVMVMKVISSSSSEFFTYTKTPAEFADRRFTIQAADSAIYTGAIEAGKEYYLVLFIKDGGGFDLDRSANGEVVDPAVIVRAVEKDQPEPPTPPAPGPDDGGAGGGCNSGFGSGLALLAAGILPILIRKKK